MLHAASPSLTVQVDASQLQAAVDAAPPHAVLLADKSRQVEVSETVRIDKPLTLVGLHMRLQLGLADTPILEIVAEGVAVRDFHLIGNGDSVEQSDRAPLIVVRRGRFLIEDGRTDNSAKDGVMITPTAEYGNIEHGVIRNLTGHDTIRDIVSIGGRGHEGLYVRHLVVENIRSYGSKLRGPVEVSDGSHHITVRDVYAESSFYGVDVQDHSQPGMINRGIVIDGVQVKDCVTAIRTANRDFGHDGLTIRNVVGEQFRPHDTWRPLHVRNTRNLQIENVVLRGGPANAPWVVIQNSDGAAIRDIRLEGAPSTGPAVLVEDADRAMLDNISINGDAYPEVGVLYRVSADERFSGLRVRNVVVPDASKAGIAIENASASGGLDSYAITDNIAVVKDGVQSERRLIERNL